MSLEDSLVGFEYQTFVDCHVLIDVDPGSVCAWLPVRVTVHQHPLQAATLLLDADVALDLGEQLVVYFNVAIWCSTDDDASAVHIIQAVLVNFSVVRSTKDLQLQVLWDKPRMSLSAQIDNNVCLSDVDQHIVLEVDFPLSLAFLIIGVHLLEGSKSNTQVLDVETHGFGRGIEPDLEVLASVRVSLRVPHWDHKIIDDSAGRWLAALLDWKDVFSFHDIRECTEEREPVGCSEILRVYHLIILEDEMLVLLSFRRRVKHPEWIDLNQRASHESSGRDNLES